MGSYDQLNMTATERLDLWDKTRLEALMPINILLFLCAAVGIFGNGVVIYIYGLRLHKQHAGRYFIPYLAVADLLAVVLSVEHHTVSNFYPVTNKLERLCIWNYMAAFLATVFSMGILLIIAVQRYLKVCKPFGRQMTLFWRRFSLSLCFMFSLALAVSAYFTFGLEKIYNKELNVTGTTCRRLTSSSQTFTLIHSATCTLFVVTEGAALIVLYWKIGKVVFRQRKQNLGEPEEKKTNTSLMFMIITIIFLVSFLPRMITSIIEGIKVGLWETLNEKVYATVRMLEVLYIVNNLANPFVYAFMDVKFVSEFKKMIPCQKKIEEVKSLSNS